jgi:hypothetical protein
MFFTDRLRRRTVFGNLRRWQRLVMMIHHISLGSNDLTRARAFYDAVMPVLGFRLLKSSDRAAH